MLLTELFVRLGVQADTEKLQNFGDELNRLNKNLGTAKYAMVALAAGATTLTAEFMALFNAGGKQELTQMAFRTMIGDMERADKLLKEMADFSLVTPFTFEEVEKNTKTLLAMGATADTVLNDLRMMGDVSAGLNVPIERLAVNYGQVRSMGRLMGREIRDFAMAGVPILEVLADMLGKSKAEITEMSSKGQISFEMTEEAFRRMTSEGGRFNNLMEKMSLTAPGLVSNIKGLFEIGLRDLGKRFNESGPKKFLEGLYEFLSVGNRAVRILEALAYGVAALGSAAVLYGIGALTIGMTNLGAASLFTTLKMLAIPILVGAGFVALGLVIDDLRHYIIGADSVLGRLADRYPAIKLLADTLKTIGRVGVYLMGAATGNREVMNLAANDILPWAPRAETDQQKEARLFEEDFLERQRIGGNIPQGFPGGIVENSLNALIGRSRASSSLVPSGASSYVLRPTQNTITIPMTFNNLPTDVPPERIEEIVRTEVSRKLDDTWQDLDAQTTPALGN